MLISDNISDDPHFIQTLFDDKTNKSQNICYDVNGLSKQSIFILEDKLSQSKIEGILMDDYYIHKIKVIHLGKWMKITNKFIIYQNEKYNWKENTSFMTENIRIDFKKYLMSIEMINEKYSLTTIVTKSKNKFGVEHLNVNFENLSKNEKRYGRILGDINKKSMIILTERIQDNQDISVEIENVKLKGKWEKRLNNECILLPFEELLGKNRKTDYIY